MFKKFAVALGLKPQEQEVSEIINIYDAVLAHKAWKKRLFDYLEGSSSEELQAEKIRVDHLCVLGRWIHSNGKSRFGQQPVFVKLVDEHAKFHAHAAKVVEAHQSGNTDQALEILGGSFNEQSIRTVNCLAKLNAFVEDQQQNT